MKEKERALSSVIIIVVCVIVHSVRRCMYTCGYVSVRVYNGVCVSLSISMCVHASVCVAGGGGISFSKHSAMPHRPTANGKWKIELFVWASRHLNPSLKTV